MSEKTSTEKMENVVNDFSNVVNSFGDNSKPFIDSFSKQHRTLQQSMFGVITKLVGHMASDEYRTDARNEQSKKYAQAFLSGLRNYYEVFERNYYEDKCYPPFEVERKLAEFRKKFDENPAPYLNMSCI